MTQLIHLEWTGFPGAHFHGSEQFIPVESLFLPGECLNDAFTIVTVIEQGSGEIALFLP
ncbi:MAG: hypothetical protein KAR19_10955 [Bacteroidales bacterium]|nr:hypothetical protein [Bacteroidales bacterium]